MDFALSVVLVATINLLAVLVVSRADRDWATVGSGLDYGGAEPARASVGGLDQPFPAAPLVLRWPYAAELG
jgi:hypothetical protein